MLFCHGSPSKLIQLSIIFNNILNLGILHQIYVYILFIVLCTIHGQELREGNAGGGGGMIKGRKKWDNCNSIIKKYILKKEKIMFTMFKSFCQVQWRTQF